MNMAYLRVIHIETKQKLLISQSHDKDGNVSSGFT